MKAVEIGSGNQRGCGAWIGRCTTKSAIRQKTGYSEVQPRTATTRAEIEGGVSNGEEIRVRGYLKPISTLRRPLQSVDFATREPVKAAYERSDVCVVPAAGVAGKRWLRSRWRALRSREIRRRLHAGNQT